MKAFTLNSSGSGDLGDAAPGLRDMAQGDQQNLRFICVFQGGLEIFDGELRALAQFLDHDLVVGHACFAFHGFCLGGQIVPKPIACGIVTYKSLHVNPAPLGVLPVTE
jgi:hypothetical protein